MMFNMSRCSRQLARIGRQNAPPARRVGDLARDARVTLAARSGAPPLNASFLTDAPQGFRFANWLAFRVVELPDHRGAVAVVGWPENVLHFAPLVAVLFQFQVALIARLLIGLALAVTLALLMLELMFAAKLLFPIAQLLFRLLLRLLLRLLRQRTCDRRSTKGSLRAPLRRWLLRWLRSRLGA